MNRNQSFWPARPTPTSARTLVLIATLGAAGALAAPARAEDCRQNGSIRIASGDAVALQKVVSDPKYAGFKIFLAPGTYALTANLTLQPGQSLIGSNRYLDRDGDGVWDPLDPLADPADPAAAFVASGETILRLPPLPNLPVCDTFPVQPGCINPTQNLGGVTLSLGNTVSNLTVLPGSPVGQEIDNNRHLIGCDFAPGHKPGTCSVRNVLLRGGGNAIDLNSARFELIGSVIVGADTAVTIGIGAINDTTIGGELRHNRIAGSTNYGILANNFQTRHDTIRIETSHNIIDKNANQGVLLMAGLSFSGFFGFQPVPALHNKIEWSSHHDAIWRNGGISGGGGVWLSGANDYQFLPGAFAMSSYNRVEARFFGTRFVHGPELSGPQNLAGGERVDLSSLPAVLQGADPTSNSCHSDDNTVSVEAHGVISDATAGHSTFQTYLFAPGVLDAAGKPFNEVHPSLPQAFDAGNDHFTYPETVGPVVPSPSTCALPAI